MGESNFDKQRARGFMTTMIDMLNAGGMSLMVSVGHRTGLFDTMAGIGPATSVELADRAQLDERYVREWLAAMASGGIVDYDSDTSSFELPAEHQTLVTRAGGQLNIAARLQYIALLGQVEDDVVDAFTTGAGVPYARFPDFQRIMAEESQARTDAALIDQIIPAISGAETLLSEGCRVADVGCGSGYALATLAGAFPKSTFVGFDFSDDALESGRTMATEQALDNLEFVALDVAQLDRPNEFDLITTFDAIHDQAKPKAVLANIANALAEDGSYLCVEPKAHSALADNMHEPVAAFQYAVSTMHCMSVSIAGGGEGLGTAWGTELTTEFLHEAGFANVETVDIRADGTNTYFVCQKS